MQLLFLAAILLVDPILRINAAGGENAQEFAVLCQLIHLAEGEIPDLPEGLKKDKADSGIEKVFILGNLTEFNESVRESQIEEKNPGLKSWLETLPIKNWGKQSPLLRSQFAVMRRRAAELVQAMTDERKKYEEARNTAQKLLAQVLYGTLIVKDKAGEIQEMVKTPKTLLGQQAAAKEAIFDSHSTEGDSCGGKQDGGAGGKSAGKTLINDFYCVCVGTSSNSNNKACHEGITQGSSWWQANSGQELAEAWPNLKAKCPKFKLSLSPESISIAVANFRGLFGRSVTTANTKGGSAIFGKHEGDPNSNACHDSTGKGCVDYTHIITTTGGIPWESKLLSARDELKKLLSAEKRLEQLAEDENHLGILAELLVAGSDNHDPQGASTLSQDRRDNVPKIKNGIPEGDMSVKAEQTSGAFLPHDVPTFFFPFILTI